MPRVDAFFRVESKSNERHVSLVGGWMMWVGCDCDVGCDTDGVV